jgi:hypothetical protein
MRYSLFDEILSVLLVGIFLILSSASNQFFRCQIGGILYCKSVAIALLLSHKKVVLHVFLSQSGCDKKEDLKFKSNSSQDNLNSQYHHFLII